VTIQDRDGLAAIAELEQDAELRSLPCEAIGRGS
jgi:hypothetical protein